jgi:hypothetical protein
MELRLALRSLRRRPAMFAAVVSAVALSVAVTAALFSVLDGLFYRALPVHDPDQLVTVDYRPVGGQPPEIAYLPELAEHRRALRENLIRSRLVAAASQARVLSIFDRYEAKALGLEVHGVDSQFFALLGVTPLVGRTFNLEDEQSPDFGSATPGAPVPIVIGYDLWRRAFGADRGVLGTRELAGRTVRIIGVMAPDVKFPGETNVWVAEWSTRDWPPTYIRRPPTYIRLAPGATLTQLAGLFPDLRFRPLREVVHPGKAGAVPLLFGAVVLLLVVEPVEALREV